MIFLDKLSPAFYKPSDIVFPSHLMPLYAKYPEVFIQFKVLSSIPTGNLLIPSQFYIIFCRR